MRKTLLIAALFAVAGSAFAAPVSYKIDANHTNVLVSWNHKGFSTPSANFGNVDGTLIYDADNVSKSSVQVTLPLSGLNTFVKAFDEHLNSADFFDSASFPTATFKSTQVEAAGEGKLKVTGDLTIKDKTHPVVLDVSLNKSDKLGDGRGIIGFNATGSIKRSDFGVGLYVPNVSDEVTLSITSEAIVPKPE